MQLIVRLLSIVLMRNEMIENHWFPYYSLLKTSSLQIEMQSRDIAYGAEELHTLNGKLINNSSSQKEVQWLILQGLFVPSKLRL